MSWLKEETTSRRLGTIYKVFQILWKEKLENSEKKEERERFVFPKSFREGVVWGLSPEDLLQASSQQLESFAEVQLLI